MQQESRDCGIACLSSIINYYGGFCTFERLRELSNSDYEGASLQGLIQASEIFGLNAEGLQADSIDELKTVTTFAILHVIVDMRYSHYIVWYGIDKKGRHIIGDPRSGIRYIFDDELNQIWKSKILLTVEPTPGFTAIKTSRFTTFLWISDLVKKDRLTLASLLLVGVVISILGLVTAIFSQKLIDVIIPSGDRALLVASIALVGLILLARNGLTYIKGRLFVKLEFDMNQRIVSKFYDSLIDLPRIFFDRRQLGDITSRLNDVKRIQNVISLVVGNVVLNAITLMVVLTYILYLIPSVGVTFLLFVPIYYAISKRFDRPILTAQKNAMIHFAINESYYIDSIRGVESVKALNRQEHFKKRNSSILSTFLKKIYALGSIGISYNFVLGLVNTVFLITVFVITSYSVLNEKMMIGELVAVIGLCSTLGPNISSVLMANIKVKEASVAFQRMFDFVSLDPEIRETNRVPFSVSSEILSLSIDGVTVKRGEKSILNDFSLKADKGAVKIFASFLSIEKGRASPA
ncbi:ABC ATPase containing transporter [Fulvivirga imtechensis AK7]|uniref:ABC ATPase containing transporter n=1 Tax=Fulvivirga imtechensis AK7 TaxID=1237149 RepID=L8JUR9_9BACT|nr:ABC ATPase containing transporter [Fulvivirga imtechensis AK7]